MKMMSYIIEVHVERWATSEKDALESIEASMKQSHVNAFKIKGVIKVQEAKL